MHAADEPIVIAKQGSFFVGGTRLTLDNGDVVCADHAYVQYQIPPSPRSLPVVMWHGGSTSAKTWETTPDDRDGYQTIFLGFGFPTYLMDQPRRGRAGRTSEGISIDPMQRSDASAWNIWRLGTWEPPHPRSFFPGVQFPQTEEAIDQFLRQRTPNTGPEERTDRSRALIVDAAFALLEKIGDAVLILHSNSGQYGWLTRIRNDKVKAIIAYEPGTFAFSADDPPPAVETDDPEIAAINDPVLVPESDFRRLASLPIQLVYGDNIQTDAPSRNQGVELWRVNAIRARQFKDAVKRRGGDVEILNLPAVGLKGNTHFPFSDLNNRSVAQKALEFLERKDLARRRDHMHGFGS